MRSLRAALAHLGPEVSCDIETDGIKVLETGIQCVGLSDGVHTVVIWPWKDSYSKPLAAYLRTRSAVVFQNGYGFDQLVLSAHGLDFTDVALEDTMVAHHAYASHLPHRLDQIVSEQCDSGPWKADHRGGVDLGARELIKYNAADCKLTALAWQRMQATLAPERAVYEHDKKLSAVCREMTRVGIGVDWERKETLSRVMKNRASALKGAMRSMLGKSDFSPSRLTDVREALFGKLRTRVVAVTASGLASTSNATLETLRGSDTKVAKFATMMLNWRAVMKSRSTYVGGTREHPLKFDEQVFGLDGRARYGWRAFGTVSGRLSSRLQSVPRHDPTDPAARAREMYIPRKGCQFVYWDVSQAEMRIAAYLSGDANFIAACGADVHQGNAKTVFLDTLTREGHGDWLDGRALKDPTKGKPYRDISKNLGFAIAYGAEAEKVFLTLRSKGFPITYRAVELILAKLRAAYKVYYRFVEKNVEAVRQCGYMRSPIIGRIRWFGWWPKPTEISNYPVQSGLSDIMNLRTIEMCDKLPSVSRGSALVAQIHDAGYLEVPNRDVGAVERLIKDIWAPPVRLLGGDMALPIEAKRGERMSELG